MIVNTKRVNLGREIVDQKMFLYARPNEDAENGFQLILVTEQFRYYMHDENVLLDTVVVEYMPPVDLSYEQMIVKAVQTLRDKQKQILAESHRKIAQLDEKINKMLLLTDQSKSDSSDVVISAEITPSDLSNTDDGNDIPF